MKGEKNEKRAKRDELRREFYAAIDVGSLTLRDAVRRFRRVLGMNQREFAKYAGISPRILMAFEQGAGNPTLATIEKMLKGSGLTVKPARKRTRATNDPL